MGLFAPGQSEPIWRAGIGNQRSFSPRPDLRWTGCLSLQAAYSSRQLIGRAGPVASPWAGESALSYDTSPVIRFCGGTKGDSRETLGDGWRRKWAHSTVAVA